VFTLDAEDAYGTTQNETAGQCVDPSDMGVTCNPRIEEQSMECRHTSSPIKREFKQTISTCMIMRTVFWDRKHVLLVEFLPQGPTINACVYCNTLQKLHCVILNK
jgi:hypothetical protein